MHKKTNTKTRTLGLRKNTVRSRYGLYTSKKIRENNNVLFLLTSLHLLGVIRHVIGSNALQELNVIIAVVF